MHIVIDNPASWGDKVNFVDSNNVVVGYDLGQNCCEHAGWYISEIECCDSDDSRRVPDVDSYIFDVDYFECVSDSTCFDDGGLARFRLVHPNKPDLFLHIFNSHNGYYGHGFSVEHSGKTIIDSSL